MTVRLLTTEQAAELCGVSAATFERRLVNSGPRFKAVRIGRRKMFDQKAIDAWIDRQSGATDALMTQLFDWEAAHGDQGARG